MCSVEWTIAGTVIAALSVIGAGAGWLLHRRAVRTERQPRIVFSDLYFADPRDPPRPFYQYAIGVQLTNVGPVPALHVHWGFADPKQQWFAELVHRAALSPGESTDDWSGIRGEDQHVDPDEASARRFYDRCLVFAECWDARDQYYLFFPQGGGKAPDRWGGPEKLRASMTSYPSRGELPRALGMGVDDDE